MIPYLFLGPVREPARIDDAELVFDLTDDGDGKIGAEEIAQLKKYPRAAGGAQLFVDPLAGPP